MSDLLNLRLLAFGFKTSVKAALPGAGSASSDVLFEALEALVRFAEPV